MCLGRHVPIKLLCKQIFVPITFVIPELQAHIHTYTPSGVPTVTQRGQDNVSLSISVPFSPH